MRIARRTVESVSLVLNMKDVAAMFKAEGIPVFDVLPLTFGGTLWHLRVAFTSCHYGGSRPWFVCPACERRAGKLYVLAGRPFCRSCHDLTYFSSQSRNCFDKALGWYARSCRRERLYQAELDKIEGQKRKQYHYRGKVIRRLARYLIECESEAMEAALMQQERLALLLLERDE
jgi:hypothetical protein